MSLWSSGRLTQEMPVAEPVGRKDDADKARWDLMPMRALGVVADVLTDGARRYAPDNWKHVPDGENRYYAAAMRHLEDWRCGQRNDPKSGLPHLAHATCCLLFLLAFEVGHDR